MMIIVFLAWGCSIAAQLQQVQLWSFSGYSLLLFASLLSWIFCCLKLNILFRHKNFHDYIRSVCIAICTFGVGFAVTGLHASYRMNQILSPELEQKDILVTGVITGLPQQQSDRWRFILNVDTAQLIGSENVANIKFPPQLLLSWYANNNGSSTSPEIKTGQQWRFTVRVKAPHGAINLHTFDYELWLWSQGIGAVGYVRDVKTSLSPQLLSSEDSFFNMAQWRESVRELIFQNVADSGQAGLITALTLGDQQAVASEDWDTFRITGIAHLISISGLHITMLAWITYALVNFLWRRSLTLMYHLPAHMAAMFAGLGCAILYAWFTGWGIPAQRTVMMLATVVLLKFLGIRWPWYVVLLFVAVVILTIDPWALLQAGFWLSFVAVGILLAQSRQDLAITTEDLMKKELEKFQCLLPQPWWRKCLSKLWKASYALLLIQLRISLVLAPLTLYLFQQVSIAGLIVNMLAIPWVTFVMVPLALIGIVIHPLWQISALAGHVLLLILDWFARLPMAVMYSASPPLYLVILSTIAAFVMVLPKFNWCYRVISIFLFFPLFLWSSPTPKAGTFEAIFLDVGQGSSVLIRTQKHTLLYDAGAKYSSDSDAGGVLIVPALRALGVSLNRIVISHADKDHAGGLLSVWKNHLHADLLDTEQDDIPSIFDTTAWSDFELKKRNQCEAGVSWVWDGVTFEVLHPSEIKSSIGIRNQMSVNAQSCVLRISTQEPASHSVLLTGDIEVKQEVALVQSLQNANRKINADVLLVPHHGSLTSSSKKFIEAVSPRFAVVQAGYLNRYKHPSNEVVLRYQAQGAQVVNTVQCGAAIWRSNHPFEIECARKLRAHYWRHQPH